LGTAELLLLAHVTTAILAPQYSIEKLKNQLQCVASGAVKVLLVVGLKYVALVDRYTVEGNETTNNATHFKFIYREDSFKISAQILVAHMEQMFPNLINKTFDLIKMDACLSLQPFACEKTLKSSFLFQIKNYLKKIVWGYFGGW
jgi:hypothetical protein